MLKLGLILLLIFPELCFAQSYSKYNKLDLPFFHYIKPKYKIAGEDISVFVIAHTTLISAPLDILPKTNGTILNTGFGASLKTRITPNNYLKTELSFIQKGSWYSFNHRETIRLNYVEIPLLWSHSWSHRFYKGKQTFFFETGLAFSMLILSSRKIRIYAEQSKIPDAQNFKNIDIPWITSIKTTLNSKGKNNLLLGFRFSYSPLSIHKDFETQKIWKFQDDGMHHITFGIQLDYVFNSYSLRL